MVFYGNTGFSCGVGQGLAIKVKVDVVGVEV